MNKRGGDEVIDIGIHYAAKAQPQANRKKQTNMVFLSRHKSNDASLLPVAMSTSGRDGQHGNGNYHHKMVQ